MIHANVELNNENPETETLPSNVILHPDFRYKRSDWRNWALKTAQEISGYLTTVWKSKAFQLELLCINKIKSYGPRIDHLVLDLKCKPE